jgi:hypothetical protein
VKEKAQTKRFEHKEAIKNVPNVKLKARFPSNAEIHTNYIVEYTVVSVSYCRIYRSFC